MEQNKTPDPAYILLFGSVAVVFQPDPFPNPIQESLSGGHAHFTGVLFDALTGRCSSYYRELTAGQSDYVA